MNHDRLTQAAAEHDGSNRQTALPHAASLETPTASSTATTGVWAGTEPREAFSAAVTALGEGLPAIPQIAQPAEGGTRWALDFLAPATGMLDLPVDLTAAGWRLARGEGREQRLSRSHTAQILDAVEEYHDERPTLLTLPGPWHLIRHMSLPSGAPVLSDFGAVRDVLQAYAFAAQAHLAEVERRTGRAPRARIVERHLDPILTGSVPTDSGFRTLPSLPEQAVFTGLQSFLARCGSAPLLHVPKLATVRIGGKDIRHADQLLDIGVGSIVVDLPTGSGSIGSPGEAPAVLAQWERLAEWADAGHEVWLNFPHSIQRARLRQTLELVWEPWNRIGMSRASAAQFGVLTGFAEPVSAGLLPPGADTGTSRSLMAAAADIHNALKEEE